MDYYIPSIMLVCTSWVTFWLQADASAPRVTLGKKISDIFTPSAFLRYESNCYKCSARSLCRKSTFSVVTVTCVSLQDSTIRHTEN